MQRQNYLRILHIYVCIMYMYVYMYIYTSTISYIVIFMYKYTYIYTYTHRHRHTFSVSAVFLCVIFCHYHSIILNICILCCHFIFISSVSISFMKKIKFIVLLSLPILSYPNLVNNVIFFDVYLCVQKYMSAFTFYQL